MRTGCRLGNVGSRTARTTKGLVLAQPGRGLRAPPLATRFPGRAWTDGAAGTIIRKVSAWSTVALSLGSAGIGAAAALAGTAMQLRHARLERAKAELAGWRDRAATVLGPILGVLDDMEPRAIAEHGGRSQQTVDNIGRRWWRARDDLLVFGVANPSPQIAATSQDLADAVARSWTSMTTLNRALQSAGSGPVDGALLTRAREDHETAIALARKLGNASRGSSPT